MNKEEYIKEKLEKLSQRIAEEKEKGNDVFKKPEVKVDIFGRKRSPIKPFDVHTSYPITIEVGNYAADTKVYDQSGKLIDLVRDLSINYDADFDIPTVTLTILNPRIISNQVDNRVHQAEEKSIEQIHNDLLKSKKNVRIIKAREFDDSGKPTNRNEDNPLPATDQTMDSDRN